MRILFSFGRFGLVGAASFVVNLCVTVVLHEVLGLSEETSFAIALATVLVTNFFAARHFVFRAGTGRIERQAGLFLASSFLFRGLEYVAFLIVHTLLAVQYILAIVGILVSSTILKFLWYRSVVFRPQPQGEGSGR